LRVAFSLPTVASRGSVTTALGMVSRMVVVRHDGRLGAVPAGRGQATFDFGAGDRRCMRLNAPDVITAARTTGVGNIETFIEAPPAVRLGALAAAQAAEVCGDGPVRKALTRLGELWPETPPQDLQSRARLTLVVEAVDPWRRGHRFAMRTLDGYSVTTLTATAIAARVLGGEHAPGFQTPAALFGPDLIGSLGCAWPYVSAPTAGASAGDFFGGRSGSGEIQ
jgi:saccharopine dehydrogenase (NAD+, L-lysine-forming)